MNALLQLYPGDRAAVLAGYVLAEITVLVALAWLVARRVARGRPAVRYGVWLCALACVALSPLTTLLLDRAGLAVWTVPVLRDGVEQLAEVATPSVTASGEAAPARPVYDPVPPQDERILPDALLLSPSAMQFGAQVEPIAATSPASAAAQPVRPVAVPLSWADRLRAAGGVVVGVWLAGIAFFLIRLVRGCWIVAALKRDAKPITNGPVVEVIELVRRRLGLARLPRIVTSQRVGGPVVVGALRPMVILPKEAIPTMGPQQMRDILVHECAHVVRRDHWVSLLQRVVEMLFWPHVLVHYLNRQLSRAREEVCDNYVLGSGDAPAYARTLLTLSEKAALGRATRAGIGLLQPRWRLEDRVAGLLDTRRDLMLRMSRCGVGAMVVAFLAVTVLVAGTRLTQRAGPVADPTADDEAETTPTRNAQHEIAVEEADDSVVVRGRVLGPDGKPFAGAGLYVTPGRRFSDELEPQMPLRAHSAADGWFEFTFRKPEIQEQTSAEPWREANIVAVAEGFGPAWAKVGELTDEGLSLRVAEDDVPIAGRVLDLEGQPIAGVTVKVMQITASTDLTRLIESMKGPHNPDLMEKLEPRSVPVHVPELCRPVTTGRDGRFHLEGIGRERLVSLSITGPTIEHCWVNVRTQPGPVIEIEPPSPPIHGAGFEYVALPTQPIVGTVRAADTGHPLSRVHVTGTVDEGFFGGRSSVTTTTNAEGRYRLAGLPDAKPYWLHVTPAAEQPYFTAGRKVADHVGLEPLSADFALVRGIQVPGTLRDGATGKPIRGQIWYYPGHENPRFKEMHESLADRNGNMHTTWTDTAGRFSVLAFPGHGMIAAAAQDTGQYTTVDLEELEGTTASATDASGINAVVSLNVPDDAGDFTQDVTLDRGRGLDGVVLDTAGRPLSGVEVLGLTSQFSNPAFVQTLHAAQFTITALRPPRPRTLIFQHRERNLAKTIVVRGDEAEPLRVQLEPCAALAGRLVDEGNPRSDFVVTAAVYVPTQAILLGARNPAPVVSDADGRFRIHGLVPHLNYRFSASSKDRRVVGEVARDLSLQPSEVKDLGDVSFEPFAQQPPTPRPAAAADEQPKNAQQPDTVYVTGRVLRPDGEAVPEAMVSWPVFNVQWPVGKEDIQWRRERCDREGRFRVRIPGGDFHAWLNPLPLVAHAPGFAIEWVLVKREDGEREVVLRLPEDRPVRGRILDTEGRPVAGAAVGVDGVLASRDGSLDGFLTAWKQHWISSTRKTEQAVWGSSTPLSHMLNATTNADGRFEIRGIGAERVAILQISAPGIASTPLWVVQREGFDPRPFNEAAMAQESPENRTPLRTVQLVGPSFDHVVAPGLSVEGSAYVSEEREPVADARVQALAAYGTTVVAKTDAQGRYVLRGLPRGVGLHVGVYPQGEQSDVLRQTHQLPPPPPDQSTAKVDFELRRGVVIQGRVTDPLTGKGVRGGIRFVPLPGNQYFDQPGYDDYQRSHVTHTVDLEGRFRMVSIPGPGVLIVQVNARETINGHELNPYRQASFSEEDRKQVVVTTTESGETRYITAANNASEILDIQNAGKYLDLDPGDGEVTCDLVLDRGRTVDVEIADDNGQRLDGSIVCGVTDFAPNPLRLSESQCTILALGPDRPRQVLFLHPERRLAGSLTLTGEEASPITLRLVPTGAITGRAMYEGAPLDDARVNVNYSGRKARLLERFLKLERGPLRTDEQGRFHVENVVPGERFALGFAWDDGHYRAQLGEEQRSVSGGKTVDYGDIEVRKSR